MFESWENIALVVFPFGIGYGAALLEKYFFGRHRRPKAVQFQYVGIIHRSPGMFRLTFPDFPECSTVGDTFEDLHLNAKEVLQFHLEALRDGKQVAPKATTPQVCFLLLEDLPEAVGFWVIRVEISK